jgi:hypothetical protein
MPPAYDSDLAKKMNFRSGMTVRVVARPGDVDLRGLKQSESADADGLIVFVRHLADVAERGDEVVAAARAGRIVWMAYPKARQLGTDLNRDILWKEMKERGVEANRQISIDDVWSALRFRAGD